MIHMNCAYEVFGNGQGVFFQSVVMEQWGLMEWEESYVKYGFVAMRSRVI